MSGCPWKFIGGTISNIQVQSLRLPDLTRPDVFFVGKEYTNISSKEYKVYKYNPTTLEKLIPTTRSMYFYSL